MTNKTNEQLSQEVQDHFISLDIPNMTIWEIYVAGFTKGGEFALDL